LKLSLEDKFEFLEREYDVVSSYTKTILSLVIALRALVENGGILKAEFLDTVPRQIELSIKRLKVDQKMDTTAKATGKMIDEVKVFREGEAIVFSDVEVQRILVTVASFADSLFKSVAGYARKVKGEL